ncbi:MAG TPA: CHAD domain-containing protein [Burkholderiaceae bacterium]|jgi:inorganic triphosphatase YgiF
MLEFELKFQVPESCLDSLTDELKAHGARSTRLLARYFDTADGALRANRLALRLRKEGRAWVQAVKGDGGSAVQRLEHEVRLRVPSGTQPMLDPTLHRGSAVGEALRALLLQIASARRNGTPEPELTETGAAAPLLIERCSTDVMRRACVLQPLGSGVEVALDLGTIRAGEREVRICELELELKSGDPRGLFALAQAWRAHGGLWLDVRPKSERGALLISGRLYGAAAKARPPVVHRQMTGPQLFAGAVRSALDAVLANSSELAAGSNDEEHVHQLRVGLRRLRGLLRDLAPLGTGVDAAWAPALAVTFAQLGALRDNQSVARAVRPLLERAGAPRLAWAMPTAELDPGAVVREARFQAALLAMLEHALLAHVPVDRRSLDHTPLDAALAATPLPIGLSPEQALAHIADRLSTLHRQVVRDGRRFEALPLERQHEVRKRLKRLRYLAEFAAPLWPGKAARRYLKPLARAQDALGHHNDIAVAADKFHADADQDPRSLFAAGYLFAHLAVTAREAQQALLPIAALRRFWPH